MGELANVQDLVQFLVDMEGGRWVIDENTGQMKFYKADNSTLVATFQLKDRNGFPTLNPPSAFERERL